MSIGTKLATSLVLPIVALMIAFALVDQRLSARRHREELAREGRAIARTVQLAVEDYLRDRKMEDLRELVDRITNYERVLGIRLFGADGALQYQSSSLDAYEVLAVAELEEVLALGRVSETRREIGDSAAVTVLMPLSDPAGTRVGAVQVVQLESYIEQDARAARRALTVLTLAMITATVLVILVVTRRTVSRPIERLLRTVKIVGTGELDARVPAESADELGRLAEEFNWMCDRLEASRRAVLAEQEERLRVEKGMRSAERLASVGRLAAGLAHEVGTPLNVIMGRTEALQRRAPDEGSGAALEIIAGQVRRIEQLVRSMLDFARGREIARAPVRIVDLLSSVTGLLEHRLQQGGVAARLRAPDPAVTVMGDADQLFEVFHNLVMNAIDAMPGGGELVTEIRVVSRAHAESGGPEREYVATRVADTGLGIPAENLDRVFDPFFTTKDIGEGTGLGLAIAYGLVREHGGWMEVRSRPGHGARVTVYLPRFVADSVAAPAGASVAEERSS